MILLNLFRTGTDEAIRLSKPSLPYEDRVLGTGKTVKQHRPLLSHPPSSLSPYPTHPLPDNIHPVGCCSVHQAFNDEIHDEVTMAHADVHRLWALPKAEEVGEEVAPHANVRAFQKTHNNPNEIQFRTYARHKVPYVRHTSHGGCLCDFVVFCGLVSVAFSCFSTVNCRQTI